MIPLAILLGGALFLGLSAWVGPPAVMALAIAAAMLVAVGVWADVRRIGRDRRIGIRRLREMRENDALNRILGPRRAGVTACDRCGDSGAVVDRSRGEWDVCSCEAGRMLSAEIAQGERDIRAGRLHRWEDVRRG